jgi:predicted amidohydrolase YtcJ
MTAYLVHNANVYTVDDSKPRADAFVVDNGRFADVGEAKEIMKRWPDVRVRQGGYCSQSSK